MGCRIGLLGQVDRAGAIDRHIVRGVTAVSSNRVRSQIQSGVGVAEIDAAVTGNRMNGWSIGLQNTAYRP